MMDLNETAETDPVPALGFVHAYPVRYMLMQRDTRGQKSTGSSCALHKGISPWQISPNSCTVAAFYPPCASFFFFIFFLWSSVVKLNLGTMP